MDVSWHIRNWFRVGKNISWKLNIHTLFGFLYLVWPREFFYKQSLKKHAFILDYLKTELSSVIEEYKKIDEIDGRFISPIRKIWILWWQGEDAMPPLVKTCIESVRRNSNGADVILINKENISSYINIPNYILDAHQKGILAISQLSDIVRCMLLEKYGGLWLDATIYVGYPIPIEIFDYNYFIWHTEKAKTGYVQHDDYHIFIMGCKPHEKLVAFIRDMFFEYWKTHNTQVDYLMLDYIIYIAKETFPDIQNEIDSLPFMSKRIYELKALMDEPYDEEKYSELTSSCLFSKLDWHRRYKLKKSKKPTLFAKVVKK